jgi:hypothetical protein
VLKMRVSPHRFVTRLTCRVDGVVVCARSRGRERGT